MQNSLLDNAKYSSWKDSHTFDNCKLNRKDYGQFLANYLIGEKDGFVLNLNGSWGTGKTEFLKRFYIELMERGHPTIYIDAWESDFSKEPLTVVASELLNQLERLMEGAISSGVMLEVKSALGKALKGTLVGLAGIASAKLLNDAATGMEVVKKLIEESPQDLAKRLAEDYQNQIESIVNVKASLSNLAESLNTVMGSELPVVVFIDELDRCRPTYAIEMLEVIKHFFTTKNFVFLVATDTEQLCHSIKVVYGSDFESNQYLKRFFNRKASLPKPDIKKYISIKLDDIKELKFLKLYPEHKENCLVHEKIIFNVSTIALSFDLKIRDVDQLIDKVISCLRTISMRGISKARDQHVNIAALITGLIEYDMNARSFMQRQNFNPKQTEVRRNFDIDRDIDVNSYLELCLNSTLLTKIDTTIGYSNQTLLAPPNRNCYESLDNPELSTLKYRAIFSLIEQSEKYNQQNNNLWLWSDLRRIIELAGTIE